MPWRMPFVRCRSPWLFVRTNSYNKPILGSNGAADFTLWSKWLSLASGASWARCFGQAFQVRPISRCAPRRCKEFFRVSPGDAESFGKWAISWSSIQSAYHTVPRVVQAAPLPCTHTENHQGSRGVGKPKMLPHGGMAQRCAEHPAFEMDWMEILEWSWWWELGWHRSNAAFDGGSSSGPQHLSSSSLWLSSFPLPGWRPSHWQLWDAVFTEIQYSGTHGIFGSQTVVGDPAQVSRIGSSCYVFVYWIKLHWKHFDVQCPDGRRFLGKTIPVISKGFGKTLFGTCYHSIFGGLLLRMGETWLLYSCSGALMR